MEWLFSKLIMLNCMKTLLSIFSSVVGFDVIFEGEYKEEALDDVMTEFEQKFREQGKPIFRIIAKKK